jgi:hypothetical protein
MSKMKQQVPSICEDCGASYTKYRPQQLFCSAICRQRHFWTELRQKAAAYDKDQQAKVAQPKPQFNDLFAA